RGFRSHAGEKSERDRARAVMKVLQLNERLKDAIAWVEEQERRPPGFEARRHGRRWRGRRGGNGSGPGEHAPQPQPGPTTSTQERRPATVRREVLFRYLEGL